MPDRCSIRALMARAIDVLDRIDERMRPCGNLPQGSDAPLCVSMDDAAKKLSVSRQTIERAVKAKELASVLVLGRRLIPTSELRRLAGGME